MQTQTKKKRNFKRKHKTLFHILSLCLVLVLTVSFSVPVMASSVTTDHIDIDTTLPSGYRHLSYKDGVSFQIASDLNSELYYKLNYSIDFDIAFSENFTSSMIDYMYILLNGKYVIPKYRPSIVDSVCSDRLSSEIILKGSDLMASNSVIRFVFFLVNSTGDVINIDIDYDFIVNSITALSDSESANYEAGYNDGYSDGLLDGEASVDTDAIYNEAYQAGYEAGFTDGSDDTLKEDKVLLNSYTGSFDLNGNVFISEYRQYADEDDLFFGTGYASGSYNIFGQNIFDIGKDYLIDFKSINITSSSPTFDITSGELVNSYISPISTFSLSGPGIYMTNTGEILLSPTQTGNTNLSVSVRGDMSMLGDYNDGVNNDYVSVPEYSLAVGSMSWVTTVEYVIDVYQVDIIEEIDYLRDLSNKMSDSNNLQQGTIDSIDNLTDTTNQQTESLNQATQQQTDTLTNGYDSTTGNEANDKLSGTLNEYQTAEDSLFATVSTGLDDYQFYDMESVPAVVTGMSFIGSLMTTWFNEAGGVSGIGIVFSVLFTVTLISMVLGLSRFYQSAGHRQQRAEHTKALQTQNDILKKKKGG